MVRFGIASGFQHHHCIWSPQTITVFKDWSDQSDVGIPLGVSDTDVAKQAQGDVGLLCGASDVAAIWSLQLCGSVPK